MAESASTLVIGELEFSDPTPQSGELDYFTATFAAEGLRAMSRIDAYLSDGLPKLLAELATDWRGWRGERKWASLDNDLILSFSHDGLGHVNVKIHLQFGLQDWVLSAQTSIDAGQLESLARKANHFFRQ